jgi:hypothetical protein
MRWTACGSWRDDGMKWLLVEKIMFLSSLQLRKASLSYSLHTQTSHIQQQSNEYTFNMFALFFVFKVYLTLDG